MPSYSPEITALLNIAQNEALENSASFVSTNDVFSALLQCKNELLTNAFSELKTSPRELLSQFKKLTKTSSLVTLIRKKLLPTQKLEYEPALKNFINLAQTEATSLGDKIIMPEHLFLAFLKEPTETIDDFIETTNLTYEKFKSTLENLIKNQGSKTPFLDKYGDNLTAKARLGELDPIIGRDAEIEHVIQILSRRLKNNPVLYGDAGVGKTAIIEGIAQKITQGQAGEKLNHKEIIELSINSIIAGTGKRGELEERLEKILKEVKNSGGQIILFIDEIHILVNPAQSETTANILKPALARGDIQAIGATTTAEYRQFFEKDAAFERRFQPVFIKEPVESDCLLILQGLKPKYENFHQIKIPDELLEEAISLSQKYLLTRRLPDKALDLLDESCAYAKTPTLALPGQISAKEKLIAFKKNKLRELDKINSSLTAFLAEEINNLDQELIELQEALKNKTIDKTLTLNAIHEVIARATGIPLNFLQKKDTERLANIEPFLNNNVIGQKAAVNKIANAILRNKAGLQKTDRPIGSFLFLGPTGVGKTELAEQLTSYLFGRKEAIIRLDMSEFAEKHAASKLIGAPPGYIGYEEGGQLTEKVRTQPYCVILFDEIEKAHPEIFDLLLQVLDEGHLTDNQGHTVDFKNTLIICTSNLGGENLDPDQIETLAEDEKKKILVTELKNFLRLELINRFDDLIYFSKLKETDLLIIIDLLLKDTLAALLDKKIGLNITLEAKKRLASLSYDPTLGARPLKYLLQQEIDTPLAKKIIQNEITAGDNLIFDYQNNQFIFTK